MSAAVVGFMLLAFGDGKFPFCSSSLSPLRLRSLSFIHLCRPSVHHLSCLTLMSVLSKERSENTACHRLFEGLSLFCSSSVFIIP